MNDTVAPGLRVLLVEDEPLVAMLFETLLSDAGCEVIGPAARIATAGALLEQHGADAAILDINVSGEPVYPLASVLDARRIPFLFVTGYTEADVAPDFRDRPVLRKPFRRHQLMQALADIRSPPPH